MTRLADNSVDVLLDTLYNRLGEEQQYRVLRAIFEAIHQHDATGNADVLATMSKDVAFTMRMQRSERYREMVAEAPTSPSSKGRSVAEVFSDLPVPTLPDPMRKRP